MLTDFVKDRGMRTFAVLWSGQLASLLGTAMTRFALLVWVYQQTGDATTLALLGFFAYIPYLLLSPVAGIVADRVDRRLVMIGADFGAGLTTLAMLVLYATGNLHIWHLYVAEGLAGAFEVFQTPAFNAATTTLIGPQHYARASGMLGLADSIARLLAPFAAGVLLAAAGLQAVMLVDVATFVVALVATLSVRIPRPVATADGRAAEGSYRHQLRYTLRYIVQRRGLLGLLLIMTVINTLAAFTYYPILAPMILGRTGGDEIGLATVQAAMGLGGILGGVVVSLWAPRRWRVHFVLGMTAVSFLLGDGIFAVGRSLLLWSVGGFIATFTIAFIVSGDRAIWQSKVAPDIQGRVFAIRNMARQLAMPLGFLLAGPLADQVFEPGMLPGGALAALFGGLIGTGAGTGMALMFAITATLGTLTGLMGYAIRPVRQVDEELPDHTPVVAEAVRGVSVPVGEAATV